MTRRPSRLVVLAAPALLFGTVACAGSDDGATVRNIDTTVPGGGSASASGAASGAGSASASGTAGGSGAASGITGTTGKTVTDPALLAAAEQYKAYVEEQVDLTVTESRKLTDAVRAGDLDAAKAAYAPSREGWERIEPIAGLVEELDGKLDARVDDFANEDDPAFTGWHRIEYLVFETGDLAAAVPFADQLDADLATLKAEIGGVTIEPVILAVGSAELIEEVSTGKITGEEDRYSHTDLWDFAANVEGSKQAYTFLRPSLEAKDASLAGEIDAAFTAIESSLEPYRDGVGWKSFDALTEADTTTMKARLATLSEELAEVAGALELS